MIRQLALIAVLALSQSLYVASDRPYPPEHNQAPDSNTTKQTGELDNVSQTAIPSPPIHVFPQDSNANPTDSGQAAKKEANPKPSPVAKEYSGWWKPCLDVVALFTGIATIVYGWHTMRTNRQSVKFTDESVKIARESNRIARENAAAAQESAKIARESVAITQESAKTAREAADNIVASERAYMTFDHTEEECENNHRVQFTVVWKNTGRTPAILCGIFAEFKSADPGDPIPMSESPLVGLDGRKLGPGREIQRSTTSISFAETQQAAKVGGTFCLCARLGYRDIFDITVVKIECLTFKVAIRDVLSAQSPIHKAVGGGKTRFDVSLLGCRSSTVNPEPH